MSDSGEIIDRFREYIGAKTDQKVEKVLGVSRSTVSSWRSRNSVPYRHFIDFAISTDLNLHWLFYGEGAMKRGSEEGSKPEKAPFRLQDAIDIERRRVEDELGIGEVALLARLGTSEGIWGVMSALLEAAPLGLFVEELANLLNEPEQKISAMVATLFKLDILKEGEAGRYCLKLQDGVDTMTTHSVSARNQGGLAATRLIFQKVLPAIEHKRGRIVLLEGRVAVGEGAALLDRFSSEVLNLARQDNSLTSVQEDAFTVVFALAHE